MNKVGKMLLVMFLVIPLILAFGSYGLYSWSLTLDGKLGYHLFYAPLSGLYKWEESIGLSSFVEEGRNDFDKWKNLSFSGWHSFQEESPPMVTEKPEQAVPVEETIPEPEPPLFRGDTLDILVIGDSLANSVGKKLEPLVNSYPDMTCRVEGVISSNLIRLDYYDWLTEGPRFAGEVRPDCILIFLGANTMQSFYLDGVYAPLFSETWQKIYKERAGQLLEELKTLDTDVYWMVLPPMQKESYNKNITHLNGIIDGVCLSEGVKRFSYSSLLTDEEGTYVSEKVVGDRQILIRSDGIHFTLEGASYISSYLIEELRRMYELPDPPEAETEVIAADGAIPKESQL